MSPFDGLQEDWVEYAERLESYFVANDITDVAKRRAILLNAVGPTTYRLIKTLCLPGKPKDHTFRELVEKVKIHFNRKPSPIIKRYEFNTRKQRPGESVAEYVAALRKIAEHCEYGGTLNDMLRDRLVCGIADKRVQNRYLREAKLTYTEARDMALAAETADRGSKRLHVKNGDGGATVPPMSLSGQKEGTIAHVDKPPDKPRVSRVRPGRGSSQQRVPQSGGRNTTCYRCGGKHKASKCKYKDYECHYCRKRGHLASVCHKKKRDSQAQTEQTHQVIAESSNEGEYAMYSIGSKAARPLIVGIKLNGLMTAMEVDTGASVSLMSEESFKSLRDRGTVLSQSNAKLFTYTGEQIPVLGATDVRAQHNGQVVTLPLIVTGGIGPTLLGRNWLSSSLKLNWQEIFTIHTCKSLFDVLDTVIFQ